MIWDFLFIKTPSQKTEPPKSQWRPQESRYGDGGNSRRENTAKVARDPWLKKSVSLWSSPTSSFWNHYMGLSSSSPRQSYLSLSLSTATPPFQSPGSDLLFSGEICAVGETPTNQRNAISTRKGCPFRRLRLRPRYCTTTYRRSSSPRTTNWTGRTDSPSSSVSSASSSSFSSSSSSSSFSRRTVWRAKSGTPEGRSGHRKLQRGKEPEESGGRFSVGEEGNRERKLRFRRLPTNREGSYGSYRGRETEWRRLCGWYRRDSGNGKRRRRIGTCERGGAWSGSPLEREEERGKLQSVKKEWEMHDKPKVAVVI